MVGYSYHINYVLLLEDINHILIWKGLLNTNKISIFAL